MYILLEPGMKIKAGDEFYQESYESWISDVGSVGEKYDTKRHLLCRREITTLKELVEAYGQQLTN